MQIDLEDLEDDDAEEFEEEASSAELCRTPRVRQWHKGDKFLRKIVGDLMDRTKRDNARHAASIQDAERHYVEGTRYDVNSYAGGPVTIADLGVIKKRKVR